MILAGENDVLFAKTGANGSELMALYYVWTQEENIFPTFTDWVFDKLISMQYVGCNMTYVRCNMHLTLS